VVGYNVLLNKTKTLTTEIENYASSLADRIELEMDKKTSPSASPINQ